MKKSTAQSSDVVDYLLGRRRLVTRRWLRAVRVQMEIVPAGREGTRQLVNQLPQLFDELCALLRAGSGDTDARADRDARDHARERWRQGYRLDELFLELDLLQRCIQTCIRDFYSNRPSHSTQAAAHETVELFFGRVIHGAIRQLQRQQDRRLSDALAERDRAAAAHESSELRVRIAAAAAGLGIFEWNVREKTAVWENERMYAITGQPFENGPLTEQQFFGDLVHPEDVGRVREALDAAIRSAHPFHAVFRIRKVVTRAECTVEVSGTFLPDASGAAGVLVGTMADITSRVRAEEALKDADRQKDVFLATLAHELRNPLAPIRNAAHLLQQNGSSAERLSWIHGVLERQSAHLSRLIDDLLDLSRIATGKITLRVEVFDIRLSVDRAIEINAPAAAQRGHRIEVIDKQSRGLFIRGDLTRITQVIANLLDNAIKYTANGGHIRLHVKGDSSTVSVSVEDNGVGLESSAIPSLFEIFAQAPGANEGAKAGLGIGLSIARSLMTMHDGTILAESEGLGKGSRFTIRLPLCAAPGRVVEQAIPRDTSADRALRIMIVDDNSDAALSLSMILDQHDVRVADTGQKALDIAREFRPQAVILDLGLPDMTGYEVARRLKENSAAQCPFLIALTGYGQPDDRARTVEAGFDHHLVKPARPEEILELLQHIQSAPVHP
jgi:CheY-like chemotaxis protein/nitrogen-specific signal transduction histidine kinase